MLFRTYEQLIVEASLDARFASRLLADPQGAALDAGYDKLVAESLVGLGGETLEEFALALHGRVYGCLLHEHLASALYFGQGVALTLPTGT